MRTVTLLCTLFALTLGAAPASAQRGSFGTAAEAKALLQKALVELNADRAKALVKFNSKTDGFQDRDLYVFCSTQDGKILSHPDPSRRGQDLKTYVDPTGKEFGKEILRTARAGEITEVSYQFPRPGGTTPVPKVSSITKVGDLVCGVGYYK